MTRGYAAFGCLFPQCTLDQRLVYLQTLILLQKILCWHAYLWPFRCSDDVNSFCRSFIYGRNINFPSRLSYRHREGVFFASEKCFYLLWKHFTICDQIKCFICCGRLLILFHCVSYSPLGATSRTFLIVLKCFWKVFVHFQGYGFLWVALCVEMMEDPSLKPNLWSAPDKVCSHFLFFG